MSTDGFDLRRTVATSIASTRRRAGWSERELARRLRTNQAAIQRLEATDRPLLNVELASRAIELLGIRITVDANPLGLADRREQRDALHALCCGFVLRRLRRDGWEPRAEVEVGDGRSRGWIDVLAYRPADRALLVIEVKTAIVDLGRTLRTVGWYARSAREAAAQLGWRPRTVTPALLVLCTVESDGRLTAQRDLVRESLPGTAAALAGWIRAPDAETPPPTIAMIDPRSRRAGWLLATRSVGRRSAAPYDDYRDASKGSSRP
jgi:hypothetical protein